ncbi:MAG: glycosyltransferase [Oscillospiraceae bacterium]|nr:glycosyltransferase [Oscillospiraceae bacterium]
MISVIIPTYNRSETIERSIRSVLNQTYSDLECIVVDDGSTDNTAEVVQSINDGRVRYYRLEHNSGACAARNKGIELAVGEYIAFQDSDDVWREHKLETQIEVLNKSSADVCFCVLMKHSVEGNKTFLFPIEISEGFVAYETLCEKGGVSTQTIFAKSYVFKDCLFDTNVRKSQDYEWSIRAGEKYSFYLLAEPLVDQYMQKVSITLNMAFDYEARMGNDLYLYHKFENCYADNVGLQITLLNRYSTSKTLAGYDASAELKELCRLSHSAKSYLKYVACKLGILRICLLYRQKTRKINALLR